MTISEKILDAVFSNANPAIKVGYMLVIENEIHEAMKQAAWHFYSERQKHITKLTDLTYDEEYTRIIFEEEWNKQI